MDLEAVLVVVGVGVVGEDAVFGEFQRRLAVDLHVAQRRGVVVGLGVHRSAVEPHAVTGSQEEDAFVGLLGVDGHIGRCGHVARIVIARVGYDQGGEVGELLTALVLRQETVDLLSQLFGVACVETVGLGGGPDDGLTRLSVARIHHDDYCYEGEYCFHFVSSLVATVL